jgi:hypothetical protein
MLESSTMTTQKSDSSIEGWLEVEELKKGMATGRAIRIDDLEASRAGEQPRSTLKNRLTFGVCALLGLVMHSVGRLLGRLNDKWNWELAAILVSAIFMTAIVIILIYINGMALDDWRLPIRPNSLVSVFVGLSKSSVLVPVAECISQAKWIHFRRSAFPLIRVQQYDEASRGPWGALQLLRLMFRVSLLATIGALLTLFALAVDPFVQQIIDFPTRLSQSSQGNASWSALQSLTDIDVLGLQGSILSGVFSKEIPQTQFTCSTSNCNWTQPLTSLAICGKCKDATARLSSACESRRGPIQPSFPGLNLTFQTSNCTYAPGAFDVANLSAFMQVLTYEDPTGQRPTEYGSQWTSHKIGCADPDVDWHAATNASDSLPRSLGHSYIDPDIWWMFSALIFSTELSSAQDHLGPVDLHLLSPTVEVCGLYFCAQQYDNIRVSNATLTSNVPTRVYDLEFHQPAHTAWWTYYGEGVFNVKASEQPDFPGNATFAVELGNLKLLQRTIATLFSLSESDGNQGFGDAFPEPNKGLDGFADALLTGTDYNAVFARIAARMTEQLRSSDSSYNVSGVALTGQTYVAVHWQWIIPPLSLLLMAIMLLSLTRWKSRQGGVGVWKSNIIALLLHGLADDRDVGSAMTSSEGHERLNDWRASGAPASIRGMNELAEELSVRFTEIQTGNGSNFVVQ